MSAPSPLRIWLPAAAMMLVSLISYIDRNTLAVLAPTLLKENNLTGEQYGWIISAFSVAYMIGNPLWGAALDRFGLRTGMLAAVAFWTLASAAHAWAAGFWGFAFARAALGFGEGATFPGGLRTAMLTLPPRWRARGIALAYSGGSLGAILAPAIVQAVANRFGWRGAFLFTGLIGAAWLLLWSSLSRQIPPPPPPSPTHAPLNPRDRRLWAFVASYALGCLPLGFVLYGTSIFLSRAWHKSQPEISAVLWIPPVGWELGYLAGGWLLDRFHQPFRALTLWALVAITPLALIPSLSNYPLVLFLLFWAMFVAGGHVMTAITYATTTFGAQRSGVIAGLGAGSWSAAVALTMPRFGALFDRQQWQLAFALATGLALLGYLLWFALQSRPPAQPAGGNVSK